MANVNIKEVSSGEVSTPANSTDGVELDTGTTSVWISVANLAVYVWGYLTSLTAKTTLVDADQIGIADSAASNVAKKITWANVKAALDALYVTLSGAYGTWTPTLTNVQNITASSITVDWNYIKIGTMVLASGQMTIQHDGSGSGQIGVSLPVASNLANSQDLNGNATHTTDTTNYAASVTGDTTNDRAQINISQEVGTGSLSWRVMFMYRVI